MWCHHIYKHIPISFWYYDYLKLRCIFFFCIHHVNDSYMPIFFYLLQDNIIHGDQPPIVPVPNAAPAAAPPPAAAPAPPPAPAPQAQAGLGAAHQAMLQGGGPTGFQPYKRPSFFSIRVSAYILCYLFSVYCRYDSNFSKEKKIKLHEGDKSDWIDMPLWLGA